MVKSGSLLSISTLNLGQLFAYKETSVVFLCLSVFECILIVLGSSINAVTLDHVSDVIYDFRDRS